MAIDVQLLRLQYEILNVSAESIAQTTGLPLSAIQDEITHNYWTRMWPDEDEPPLEIAEGEDTFKLQSDRYVEKTRKRLYAYALAKEVLLATRYLELEAGLISKANECLTLVQPETGIAAVKMLSSLWKDMQKSTSANSAFSFGTDEMGLPTVVVKDLSGRAI
jgi:hypothetical protein